MSSRPKCSTVVATAANERCAARRLDSRHKCVEPVAVTRREGDGGAFRGEVKGSGATDAAAGARDDRNRPGELSGHAVVPFEIDE
jgi:hypothetical protein